jgi:DNA-binding transcriptional MerR regulator
MHRVSEVARIANVTVRTLHHYDEIGLLQPSGRTNAGYRLYSADDLLRLHRIVVGRSLGLSLEEIRRSLDDPEVDPRRVLSDQRTQLLEQLEQTHAKIRSIDAALAAMDRTGDDEMDFQQMFDGFDPADYEQEAKARWGNTPSFAESQRRTSKYTKDDWAALKAEADEINRAWAAAREMGTAATDEAAMDVAERHRRHIDRWFYPCSAQMHAGLADMFVADPRFAANFDKYGDDLTAYVAASIKANAQRQP